MLTSPSYPVTPETRAEGLPETREHGRDVSPETGEPEEAGSQADEARAASGPPARGAHKVTLPLPRYVWACLTPSGDALLTFHSEP